VPRAALPRSQQYFRVRAVYEQYGPLISEKMRQPLFNDISWKKANGVLEEILEGYTSTPPDISFTYHEIDADGNPAFDENGLELFHNTFGTNREENYHKQISVTFGSWKMSCEMSTCVLNEHRHRYTHNVSERHRPRFPTIGHYDTWIFDALQNSVEMNHGILLYPGWTNSSDYLETTETFRTGVLQTNDLTNAVNSLDNITEMCILTADQRFLARAMGVKLPFTPSFTVHEKKLFATMMLQNDAGFDENQMALDWVRHVDGKNIMPKLPVYLRNQ